MEALVEQTKTFEKDSLMWSQKPQQHQSNAKLSQDLIDVTDLNGGWATLGMGGIWQPKHEYEESQIELKKVKEELEMERKEKIKLIEERNRLEEQLEKEKMMKKELDERIQTLEANSLTEKSSWENQLKVIITMILISPTATVK